QSKIQGARLCLGNCDSIRLKITSAGNETVHISGITGGSFIAALPITIAPMTDTDFLIRYCAAPEDSVIVQFLSDADSANSSIIYYHVIHPEFVFDTSLQFKTICAGEQDSLPFTIRRTGDD